VAHASKSNFRKLDLLARFLSEAQNFGFPASLHCPTNPDILRRMDESKFISSCHDNSFYISLHDQKLKDPPKQKISTVDRTHVHFVIQHGVHWAAVQLEISPFSLAKFPGQKFFKSRFRYSLCCHPLPGIEFINSVVQRIYDDHFHPCLWDFSPKS